MLAVMKSIQSLLTDPNTSSPANTDAAKLFDSKQNFNQSLIGDKEEYYRRVKDCVMASLIC
jgi:ubiquitin-protein ligase